MYIANARILRLGPNATYIPLTRVGVLHWGKTCWFSQCKILRWGSKPTQGPNANVFCVAVEYRLKSLMTLVWFLKYQYLMTY